MKHQSMEWKTNSLREQKGQPSQTITFLISTIFNIDIEKGKRYCY